jgi:dTDP-4-dehydrorhamnose 3,5-epimerase-like enzyme
LSSAYNPQLEHAINFFDEELKINLDSFLIDRKPLLSERDRLAPGLIELEKLNLLPPFYRS